MRDLRYTLITDGSLDQALLPILNWLLRQQRPGRVFVSSWIDFRRLRTPPQTLHDRIATAVELSPCDVLFVHRDAETMPLETRHIEITDAAERARRSGSVPPIVCVIPVRMQEAWLLFDESAIRQASGNPRGTVPLNLPRSGRVETEPDPKMVLHEAIRIASGLSGRRLQALPVTRHTRRVAELVDDFTPLRNLSAFGALERELQRVLESAGW